MHISIIRRIRVRKASYIAVMRSVSQQVYRVVCNTCFELAKLFNGSVTASSLPIMYFLSGDSLGAVT